MAVQTPVFGAHDTFQYTIPFNAIVILLSRYLFMGPPRSVGHSLILFGASPLGLSGASAGAGDRQIE